MRLVDGPRLVGRRAWLRTLLAVALVAAACSREKVTDPVSESAPAAAPAPVAKPEEPATIRGVVRWVGTPIAPQTIRMTGDALLTSVWGDGGPPDPRFEVAADGALPHAFVWASSGPHTSRKWDVPETPVDLRGERGLFVPHVLGVMCRQPLALRSADYHYNFHVRPAVKRNEVNVCIDRDGRAVQGMSHKFLADQSAKVIRFDQPEKAIPVAGDLLTWMQAFVFVLDHPFFATTDASGRFEIRGLPPGEYVFRAWHEGMTADARSHEAETRVTLASGAAADVSLELR